MTMTKQQEKCPYCATNHSKDLFSSDGRMAKSNQRRKQWKKSK